MQRILQVDARHLVRTDAHVERTEFEPDPRQVGVVDEHALQRGDRRVILVEPRRQSGELEHRVEICRPLEQGLE